MNKQKKDDWKAFKWIMGITGFIVLIMFIGFLIMLVVFSNSTGLSDSTGTKSLNIGEEGIVYAESRLDIPIGLTKQAINDWIDAEISNDEYGTNQLIYSGNIFPVASGTSILRLSGASIGLDHIRILEGPYKGTAGYTPYENVRPK